MSPILEISWKCSLNSIPFCELYFYGLYFSGGFIIGNACRHMVINWFFPQIEMLNSGSKKLVGPSLHFSKSSTTSRWNHFLFARQKQLFFLLFAPCQKFELKYHMTLIFFFLKSQTGLQLDAYTQDSLTMKDLR